MKKRIVASRSRFMIGCAVAVLVGLALPATAVTVGSNKAQSLRACIELDGGPTTHRDLKLRAGPCQRAEKEIAWPPKGSTGPRGPQGEKGNPGEKGDKGEQGPPGSTSTQVVTGTPVPITIATSDFQQVYPAVQTTCPDGTTLVGGGYSLNPSTTSGVASIHVAESGPVDSTTWQVIVETGPALFGQAPRTITVTAEAICAG